MAQLSRERQVALALLCRRHGTRGLIFGQSFARTSLSSNDVCKFIRSLGVVPKYFASRSAIAAVIVERPWTTSLMRPRLTPVSRDSRPWVMPFGF